MDILSEQEENQNVTVSIAQDKVENIDQNDEEDPKHSSKAYLHTGKNEDHIEVRGVNTEHSRKEQAIDDNHEESISLKATKPDIRQTKKSNKVQPEKNEAKKSNNPFEKKITYLNATKADLEERNLGSCRLAIAQFMRSKPVDIFIIVLIILYTLLVIVYLAIDDEIEDSEVTKLILQIAELVFLFIF